MRPARWIVRASVIAVAAGCAGASTSAAAAVPAGNLLKNPGAEEPPFLFMGLYNPSLGWSSSVADEASQGPYDSCYGGTSAERNVVGRDVGAAIGGGARVFFAGQQSLAFLSQRIPVVTADVVGKPLLIGGLFGGYLGQGDSARIFVRFLNAANAEIGVPVAAAAVTAADRGNVTTLLPRSATGVVPPGTATLEPVLEQRRTAGFDNDGYADNLYVTFDAGAPPPVAGTGDPACASTAASPAPVPPPPVAAPPPPVAASPAAPVPPPTAAPVRVAARPTPTLASVVSGLPSVKRCVSRRAFRIRLRNPPSTSIVRATVAVDGKTVAVRKGRRVTAPVNLRGLPSGSYTVRITTKLSDGTTVTGTRKYRTCARKRSSR